MSDPPVLVAVVCRACGGTGIVHAQVAVGEPLACAGVAPHGLELDDVADTEPAPAPGPHQGDEEP